MTSQPDGQLSGASALSFTVGAQPLSAIMLPPPQRPVSSTFIAVLPALVLTGASSARIGGSSPRLGRDQVVLGGAAGLAITYLVGDLFGVGV